MFFVLSKIAGFFLQPLNLVTTLLGISIIASLTGFRAAALAVTASAFALLALAAWTSLGAALLNPLEERFKRPDPAPETVAGVVVLGGGLEGAINLARGGYELNSSGDRFVEAAVLARRYPAAKVVVSGGMGTVLLEGEGDADTAPRLLEALGVTRDRLILENRSRNTDENARFTKEMVQPEPGETWLLVTSAFHMPRSVALFRKAGFPVTPWPVDYRTSGREGFGFFRDNAADALQTTTLAVREWIGLAAYRISGRTDEFLASPD